MRQQDLIKLIASDSGVSQKNVRKVINSFKSTVEYSITCGDTVYLRDFGTFRPRIVPQCRKHNPRTLEIVTIPEKLSIKFLPSRFMRKRLELVRIEDEKKAQEKIR